MLIQLFATFDQHRQDHEVQILVFLEFTPKLELDFIFEFQELHSNHLLEEKLFAIFHQLAGLIPFTFYSLIEKMQYLLSHLQNQIRE